MQLSGLLHGAKLMRFVNFPVPEVLGPEASEAEIKAMLDRHGIRAVQFCGRVMAWCFGEGRLETAARASG
jgi:hypothetical protein